MEHCADESFVVEAVLVDNYMQASNKEAVVLSTTRTDGWGCPVGMRILHLKLDWQVHSHLRMVAAAHSAVAAGQAGPVLQAAVSGWAARHLVQRRQMPDTCRHLQEMLVQQASNMCELRAEMRRQAEDFETRKVEHSLREAECLQLKEQLTKAKRWGKKQAAECQKRRETGEATELLCTKLKEALEKVKSWG